MRSASEFHRRSVENLRRRWRFVFQSPAAKRFGAITARSSAGRRGAEEVAALQGQIQALQIELENPSHALALLRPRRERPRGCRAAEQRDERAPLHSITSSARASNVGGISRPSIIAVARLMTNSNLVDCTTGRSAGFTPWRMRPAYTPAWRSASVTLAP